MAGKEKGAETAEYLAVKNCYKVIHDLTQFSVGPLANGLFEKGLIDVAQLGDANHAFHSPHARASGLLQNVLMKIYNRASNFYEYVSVLKECDLMDIASKLESALLENKRAAQNARTQGVEKGGHSSDSAIAAKNVGTQIEGHPPKHAVKQVGTQRVETDSLSVDSGKLMQLNFTKDVLKKMSNNDTVERISAVINLAGLPKSGKTTLISRLLGRKFEHDRPSTGICNTTLAVDLQPAQLYAVELGEDFIWENFEHYKSLQNQLYDHIPSNVPESDSSPAGVVNDDPADNNVEMNDTVMNLIKGLEIDSFKKLATKGSVYIRDVGGQPEFKQGLSILVFGPSIFLFVFNAFIDIDEEQSMKYRFFDDNEVMQCIGNLYESKMSTKTALLQFLSSVKSICYTTTGDGESYEPVVLIVGTHIDLLSEDDRLSRIEQIHDKLKKVIEPNFTDIVLDTVDSKPMFAVNNVVDNDSGLQSLREKVNTLLNKRKCPHPIKYVLFALDLMKRDQDVLTFKECEELAQKFEIDNTSSLLNFFHVHVGTLLWFDPQQLSNWVFKNPQFLFNKITDIILKTFVNTSLGRIANKAEAQQHGIFEAEKLESMLSTKKCGLEPDEFLRFFIHLRMIAEFEDKQNGESIKKYFIPSFLCHGCNDHDDFLLDTRIKRISPLSFTFAYGSPDGLFGVLVCTLWQDQHMEEGEDISFEAVIKEIYKNKVTFKVHIAHDVDTIALVMHSSCLDMQFIPEVSETKKRSFPVEKSCCMVHEAMKKCISNSLDTLRYDKQKVKHQTSFKCHNEECDQRHAVEGEKGIRIMRCSAKTFDLKEKELYWFNEATYCAQESKKVERADMVMKITYNHKELLGSGSHGTMVYKGKFEERDVAVKEVRKASLAEREARRLVEADRHPCIIRYYCQEERGEFRYLALELAVCSLYDYVTKRKYSEGDAIILLQQAIEGLSHLHKIKIVHRDIKPENILLFPNGSKFNAKLSDFGFSKNLSQPSGSIHSCGSLGWMAPEVESDKLSYSMDIFSMGCVIYFVLTSGQHPFGSTPIERQGNIQHEKSDLSKLFEIKNYTAFYLVQSMISHDSPVRPTAEEVCCHCLFWSEQKQLDFFKDIHCYTMFKTCEALEDLKVLNGNWIEHITSYKESNPKEDITALQKLKEEIITILKRDLVPNTGKYNGSKMQQLLRFIRNMGTHFDEPKLQSKAKGCCTVDDFVRYITSEFPLLLQHNYNVMKKEVEKFTEESNSKKVVESCTEECNSKSSKEHNIRVKLMNYYYRKP